MHAWHTRTRFIAAAAHEGMRNHDVLQGCCGCPNMPQPAQRRPHAPYFDPSPNSNSQDVRLMPFLQGPAAAEHGRNSSAHRRTGRKLAARAPARNNMDVHHHRQRPLPPCVRPEKQGCWGFSKSEAFPSPKSRPHRPTTAASAAAIFASYHHHHPAAGANVCGESRRKKRVKLQRL